MNIFTKKLMAMLLSGMLIIGSASGSVFAADVQENLGQTAEVAVEEVTEESVDAAEEDSTAEEESEEISADASEKTATEKEDAS